MGTYTFSLASLLFLVCLQYTASIRCLSCNDVIQPRHCSRIEHCPEGDACVTDSYQNKNGETLFNVGCMSAQRCSFNAHHNRSANFLRSDIIGTHVPNVCVECCHSDLCNAAGCGTNGYPKQRGPICLDCLQSRDPALCDVISVCLQGEVCHVEEIYEFGDVFYKTSCSRNTDHQCSSPPIYNPVAVGRRSTRRESCFFCCPDDLCNSRCNAVTSLAPSTVQTTTPVPKHHSFKGKEFFLMFMDNLDYSYSSVKLSANVTFLAPSAQIQVITRDKITSKLVYGPVKQIDIDANMTMRENGKTSKGIIVTSNTPMSVTASNVLSNLLGEEYFALPIESLGVSYIVGTFRYKKNPGIYGPSFAVGAPYDNTVVNITLSTSASAVSVPGQYHKVGDTITVVLYRLDTFYIETNTAYQDLTGTRIVSDKPVAVVSGTRCSYGGFRSCNHLVEYLPPVLKWGSIFMVPPIINTTRSSIRIVSSVNNTSVVITAKTSNKTYTVSTFIDVDTNQSQPYAISSDNPVLVLLIVMGDSVGMSVVPSINQFSNEPVLISPPIVLPYHNSLFDNYIVVSIRSNEQSGLQLRSVNGADMPRVASVDFPDADGKMYSFISVTCNHNQTCSVQHSDDNVTFSVISYGFTPHEVYAYPANLSL